MHLSGAQVVLVVYLVSIKVMTSKHGLKLPSQQLVSIKAILDIAVKSLTIKENP